MEDLQNSPSCVNDWSIKLANDAQFVRHLNGSDSYHFSNEENFDQGVYLRSNDELQQE